MLTKNAEKIHPHPRTPWSEVSPSFPTQPSHVESIGFRQHPQLLSCNWTATFPFCPQARPRGPRGSVKRARRRRDPGAPAMMAAEMGHTSSGTRSAKNGTRWDTFLEKSGGGAAHGSAATAAMDIGKRLSLSLCTQLLFFVL